MTEDKKQIKTQENAVPDPKDSSRRKAVKKLVAGAGALAAYHVMPTDWSKPLIEQVFLPAHAQTSGTSLNDPCDLELLSGTQSSAPVEIRVNGYVMPRLPGLAAQIVAAPVGAGSPQTATTTTDSNGDFTVDFSFPNVGITRVNVTTTVTGAAGAARCAILVPGGVPTTTPFPARLPMPTGPSEA